MKVLDLIRHNVRKSKETFGLEIEVEGDRLPNDVPGWRTEHDGSLRGKPQAVEYVIRGVVSEKGLEQRLNRLETSMKQNDSYFCDDSKTAGIHVHINFQQEEAIHLFNFITLYYIVEKLLLTYCAPHRRSNHFCINANDADVIIDVVQNALHMGNFRVFDDNVRYSSMNLASLNKFGSVEFRSLESTSDFKKIMTWCKILNTLKERAEKFEDPQDIITKFSSMGDEFLAFVFGDYYKQFNIPEASQYMFEGMRMAQDIAYCTQWDRFRKELEPSDNVFDPQPQLAQPRQMDGLQENRRWAQQVNSINIQPQPNEVRGRRDRVVTWFLEEEGDF